MLCAGVEVNALVCGPLLSTLLDVPQRYWGNPVAQVLYRCLMSRGLSQRGGYRMPTPSSGQEGEKGRGKGSDSITPLRLGVCCCSRALLCCGLGGPRCFQWEFQWLYRNFYRERNTGSMWSRCCCLWMGQLGPTSGLALIFQDPPQIF